MNPLAIYRLARRTVPEKHAETTLSPPSIQNTVPPEGNLPQVVDYSLDSAWGDFMQPTPTGLWDIPQFPMDLDGWQPANTILEGGMWVFETGEGEVENDYMGTGI